MLRPALLLLLLLLLLLVDSNSNPLLPCYLRLLCPTASTVLHDTVKLPYTSTGCSSTDITSSPATLLSPTNQVSEPVNQTLDEPARQ